MPNKLRIAIVHDFLLKLGGAEKVLLELLKIFPSADVYTLLYSEEGTGNRFSEYSVFSSELQKGKNPPKGFKYLLSKFPKAIESFDLSEYNLVISLSNSFAHGVITPPSCLHICYCMSPTRYLYDWKEEYLLENNLAKGLKGAAVRKILSDLRIWDQEIASRPDHYLAISEHVRKRIKKYYRLDSRILFPPTDLSKYEPNYGLPEDYYIIISRLSAYKKIDLAVEAFNESGDSLIIIGTGEDEKRLKSLAKGNVEFLGWQSDEATREYLRYAKALIFPGEEDFGLTPVESMASGRPVIAYRKGGVTETVREGQDGVFFSEPTKESLVAALTEFDQKMKLFDSKKIRSHAEEFSLEFFKEKLIKIINSYAKTS
jgi:glycosyltransferase involved in cell wall biosynthesis